ncbi:c-type cytochrome biogenesis protein CcmI [Allochromatium vinosum]|uniref:Cytochrome c-type biogenesis protein CcmI n=1 Tax=Allochromatium vinosum (strain ATCC 17899 / DSM 180 / NBRC 103801 / NCIMB 10441 / D) TaxID=572477 RepID=D3RVU0_ALLVD|nr:c-type cytochrome biogenesis protein CcmI [Allochromatium vinosum]ADC63103.1 cytochrome c-type biogenesis protein CcmI [Allochromatium vinosum DSM 180]
MIIFWILAGILLALSLVFVLAPLVRPTPPDTAPGQDRLNLEVFQQRLKELDADLEGGFLDQAQYDAARRDLERELLYDLDGAETAATTEHSSSALSRWALALVLTIVVPAATVLAYLEIGRTDLIDQRQTAAMADGANTEAASLEELVQQLEKRLEQEPANIDGWMMLSRTYLAMGRLNAGAKAMERAYALAPNEVELKIAYAEVLGLADPNKSLLGRPAELIAEALAQEPTNSNARWFSGLVAFQRGQYQAARTTWQSILDELAPESEEADNLRKMMDEALRRAGIPAETASVTPGEAGETTASETEASASATPQADTADTQTESEVPAATSRTSLTVAVSLDPSVSDRVSPDDTVFVFARAVQGPPMPLAVQRLQVKDLPATVTLDDSQAMNPALRLSAFEQVQVGARVSMSGQATPQPGDLFGESEPVQRDAGSNVRIRIDRVRP